MYIIILSNLCNPVHPAQENNFTSRGATMKTGIETKNNLMLPISIFRESRLGKIVLSFLKWGAVVIFCLSFLIGIAENDFWSIAISVYGTISVFYLL